MSNYQKIELKSKYEELYLIENFIENIAEKYNILNSYFGNILIAVNESVKNAIKHGNNFDSNKKVCINFEQGNDYFSFEITDEGKGFDYSKFPEPDLIEKEGSLEGRRGIYLIKKLADEVNYFNEGRTIKLLFKIGQINEHLVKNRIDAINQFGKEKENTSIKAKNHI